MSLGDLEKQLKVVTKTGKYIVGRKEVLNGLKGSKLVVWSSSANVPPKLLNECKELQVPAVCFSGSPIELGKLCGIPYKVSVISVKTAGDAILRNYESAREYSSPRSKVGLQSLQPSGEEPPSEETTKAKRGEEKEAGAPARKRARTGTSRKTVKVTNKETETETTMEGEGEAKPKKKRAAPKKTKKKREEEEEKFQAEENTDEEEED